MYTRWVNKILFINLSDNINIHMFTTRVSHISWESDTLPSREKYSQLVHILEIFDRINGVKKQIPVLEMSRVVNWLNNSICFSIVQSMNSMNVILLMMVTTLLVNFSCLQQLWINALVMSNAECEQPFSASNMNTNHFLFSKLDALENSSCFDVHMFSWSSSKWIQSRELCERMTEKGHCHASGPAPAEVSCKIQQWNYLENTLFLKKV
jgi:hypothetical protein